MTEISDSDFLPLSLKHSFWTWSAQSKVSPIPVKRAKGVYFWDVDGKRYLDFNSMVMNVNIGHGDDFTVNKEEPEHLTSGITVIGKGARLPSGLKIGRNCKIGCLVESNDLSATVIESGETVVKKKIKRHIM